jgi:hypothetical protein
VLLLTAANLSGANKKASAGTRHDIYKAPKSWFARKHNPIDDVV